MKSRLPRTTLITVGLLAFLAGLGLARHWPNLSFAWAGLSLLLATVVFLKRRAWALVAAIGLGLMLGWWRGGVFMGKLRPYEQVMRKSVVVRVRAENDAVYGNNGQLSFDGAHVRLHEPFEDELTGRLKIQGFGESAVYRGDLVEVSGKPYPTRGSRQATLSYAALKVLGRNHSPIDTVRRRFAAGMASVLPEPHASFALGLLIGQRTTLPKRFTDNLSAVGLTHIIAVSGYNLTIIVRATRRFGKKRSKYQVTLLSLLLIGSFLLVTGFSASIVRAALVSLLSLWAWYYGRAFRPLLLLALAAALTAGWNPLYIWSDIGWYLSFLAFYGVLILVPLVVRRLYGADKQPRSLTLLFYETIGAQVMTAPLILYIFKEVSLVALVSNLLVVPLVPLAMLLALVAGLGGMIMPALGGWLALPASFLLAYMIEVVNALARLPHALLSKALPLLHMLVVYAGVAVASFGLWRKTASKYDTITEKETMLTEDV